MSEKLFVVSEQQLDILVSKTVMHVYACEFLYNISKTEADEELADAGNACRARPVERVMAGPDDIIYLPKDDVTGLGQSNA